MAFSGTVSLRRETFEAVVLDYVGSLARHGFRRILIIPSHGGNFEPLGAMKDRLQEAAGDAEVMAYTDLVAVIRLWRRCADLATGWGERVGGHADLAETSIMLSLHPDLVRMELAENGFLAELSDEVITRILREGFDSVTPNGILGDARGATAELGGQLIGALADELVAFFQG